MLYAILLRKTIIHLIFNAKIKNMEHSYIKTKNLIFDTEGE